MSVWCSVIELLYIFVFVNFSNILQVYVNLKCIWLFLSSSVVWLVFDTLYLSFFVFFSFSNVLSVYLNLRVYLFVFVFVVKVLFRLAVFTGNLLAGDVHSSVALDRHADDKQHLPTPFFLYKQLFLTLAPKIVQALLRNRSKKLFSNCLVDGPLNSIV